VRVPRPADAALVAALLLSLGATAAALALSWGGASWLLDTAAGTLAGALALARRWTPAHPATTWPTVATPGTTGPEGATSGTTGFAVAAAPGAGEVEGGAERGGAGPAFGGLAVAGAAIVVSRVTGLPHEPGPALVLALAVLQASAIRRLPLRPAAAVTAGGLLVVAASALATLPGDPIEPIPVLALCGWLAACAAGLGLRLLDARRRAVRDLVRQDERLTLARELHDVVAHHVTGILVQAQAAQLAARRHPETPPSVGTSLQGIETAAGDALDAMRRLVGFLRDESEPAPTSAGPERLTDLVDRFARNGHDVRLELPTEEPAWPPEVTSTVYRVVQEALTNVVRHAPQASTVSVSVAQQRQTLTVEIVDDGPPATPKRGGYGLLGMRERVETLGGTLRAGPRPGTGWSVLATVPIGVSSPTGGAAATLPAAGAP
jgi:signal transduction histidine kinase